MNRNGDTVTAVTGVTAIQAGEGPAKDSILLGKYRVEATLGFGGMGLVIRAHNLGLDEKVAIKFLREDVQLDDEHVERFLREAKAAVRLKSEHVAKIRDVGTLEDGRPYMVMELLEGLDLGKLLIDVGAIDPARAVDLVLQTCDALAEAHALGIVHRDIKPTNLFVTRRRDDSELLKVLDFGISKAQSATELSLTQTSSMLGTPAYMSPEQMRSARTVDSRSDIWALGTVLYELVEGRPPFAASNFAELCVMVSTEPFAPMTRAPQLERVIGRCLAKSVDERYQDVGELAIDLEPFAPEPGLASRQVARVLRVLGKAGRDSTPLPMSRDSLQRIGSTADSSQRIVDPVPAAPTALPVAKSRGGIWKGVLLLLLLFGIGIAAGLFVTSGGDDTRSNEATGTPADAEPAATVETAGSAAISDAAPADVAIEAVEPATIDAGVVTDARSAQDAGKPHASTVRKPPRKPPPRKPPPRKPPPKKPPAPGGDATPASTTGSATTAPPPPEPPPPKCDPYANPKGCNKKPK